MGHGLPQKQTGLHQQTGYVIRLDSAFNLVGAKAPCTDIYMARSTVHDSFDALDVGLPGSVGTPVGMGDLNAEGNALSANITFCHLLHLLACDNQSQNCAETILPDFWQKCKHYF